MKKYLLFFIALLCSFLGQSQSWSLTGNAAINPKINFLGTKDNNSLLFRVNNNPAGEIDFNNGKTSFGYGAGQGGTGTYSVAIGYRALNGDPGYENTALGSYALQNSTSGSYNVAVGYGALQLTTSSNSNAALGYGTMSGTSTGHDNTAAGRQAMYTNHTGNFNTAIGSNALFSTSNSWYNTAVGYNAGIFYDLGYNNTILGANCGGSFAGQYNMVAIGQGVTCPDNSTARIGNSATWSIGGWAGWSNFSDGRFKKDIKEGVAGLAFIMKLRPITYHLDVTGLSKQLKENQGEEWNVQMKTAIAEKEKMLLTGFVAQEVEKAAKETGFDFSGVDKPKTENGLYALRYAEFVVPLVKAVQEQQQLIKDLQAKVDLLQQQANATIDVRSAEPDALLAYPNPSGNNVTVIVKTQKAGNGILQVFDGSGKQVKQLSINIRQGVNTVPLAIPGLASGYYDLKLDWGTNMHKHVSIIKQ
jgi:hypothetical protein